MENNPWCRFDPYAQQKLEQREAALKKFYKAEEDADEEGEREGTAEKIQGIKEMEAKEGLCELGQDQKVFGESVAPLLSSVFDEEAAADTGQKDMVTESSVNDNVACEGEDDIMMESVKAHNLETTEEKSEKPVTSDEEEPSNEQPRDENGGNSKTLKLVPDDTEVLDDTVVEKDDKVDEKKLGEEEESLKLVLEPDTPVEEEEIVLSSQV